MVSVKKLIGSVVLLLLFTQVNAQEEPGLRIGDPAPPLKYSKWLKGEPVTSFKDDQLYILEFWATWCGPCKQAMPHLTELQKEYEGKVTIIGADIWEKIKEGQPYESSLPKVERYVQGNSANMGYSIIADNNDEHMGNNWMKAAGQTGIPATFIIKNGKVIWIGHPMALDTLLPKIFNGSYDMAAHKIKSDKKLEAYKKSSAAVLAELKPINDALAAKEYEKAYELMEKLAAEKPMRRALMYRLKFTTLLQQGQDEEAIEVANEWQKEIKSAPVSIFLFVSDKDNLSEKIYLWAVKLYEAYYPGPYAPLSFHARASMYAKGGDYRTAIALEEKAIEGAKVALEKGELEGIITDHTVEEYDKALAGYKKAGKTGKK